MLGKPSRRMWIAAIVVSVVCVAGFAYALITEWDTEPDRRSERSTPSTPAGSGGGGFSLGLVVGLGAGIVLGSLLALRRR